MNTTLKMWLKAIPMIVTLCICLLYQWQFSTPPLEGDLVTVTDIPQDVMAYDNSDGSEYITFKVLDHSFTYRSSDEHFTPVKNAVMNHSKIAIAIHPHKKYTVLSGVTRFWKFSVAEKEIVSYEDCLKMHAENSSLTFLIFAAIAAAVFWLVCYLIARYKRKTTELSNYANES